MPSTYAFKSIAELGRLIRQNEVTSLELTQYFLDRLNRLGGEYNAVVRVTADLAIEQARTADAELRAGKDRGPLHGIPCGVKDLLATKGIPTSWGAAPFQDRIIDQDATVITKLRDAGAVLCAKLAMVEIAGGFGYKQANASFTGPGLNPWDKTCWSGGSSSGPASAVGTGLVPFAIGSETMGSIITPSGYSGVTGLRPTYGRVSRHGAMALSWTMDKIGPMCITADDCGTVLNAIAGADPSDTSCLTEAWTYTPAKEPRSFRFAVVDSDSIRIQAEVRDNYHQSLDLLRGLGTIETIELPDFPYSIVGSTIISSEMAAAFESFIADGMVWKLTAPEDRWGGHSNLLIPAKDYINALRIRVQIQKAMDQIFKNYDAIITPTLNTEAGPVAQRFSDWSRGFVSNDVTAAANVAGLPAITLPNGFGNQGLPTAIEFTGRAFDENTLLEIATILQKKTDWHSKHPPGLS